MNLFYDITNGFALLVTLVTMIFAFTWKARKGKWLLCTFLILSFIASFLFRILNLLLRWGPMDFSMMFVHSLNAIGVFLYQAANILLLCFVIVARKPSSSLPPIPVRSDFSRPSGNISSAGLNDMHKPSGA
jgi:hypothetical protein